MKRFIACILSLSALQATAQLSGSNAFLRGHYVEVGIGRDGYYGSDSAAPTGYHPHCTTCTHSSAVGFVADPAMTGWSTGSSSHYMGDYFLPGSPFEGWMLQIGTAGRAQGYGGNSGLTFSGGLSGTAGTISYTASGSTVSSIYQGTFDSVVMSQETILDTNDFFFITKITLTNTAVAPKNDIYYFRSLDPDNDETWPGGGFTTTNQVVHQMPYGPNQSLVTAVGATGSLSYLGLGTADTASRAVIYNCWGLSISTDLLSVYSESPSVGCSSAFYDTAGPHPGDIGIGLVMYVPHLATVDSAGDSVLRTTSTSTLHPANTATFSYFYSFSSDASDSAVNRIRGGGSTVTPTAIRTVNPSPDIRVYPNPAHDNFTVTGLSATDHLSLFDMMGREVIAGQPANGAAKVLSLQDVPAGSYILIITDDKGNISSRVPVRKI